jgi:hypothetical protein
VIGVHKWHGRTRRFLNVLTSPNLCITLRISLLSDKSAGLGCMRKCTLRCARSCDGALLRPAVAIRETDMACYVNRVRRRNQDVIVLGMTCRIAVSCWKCMKKRTEDRESVLPRVRKPGGRTSPTSPDRGSLGIQASALPVAAH